MVIDRGSTYGEIEVKHGTPGLTVTPSGFEFKTGKDLALGLHEVHLHIEDNHGNPDDKECSFNIVMGAPMILNVKPGIDETINNPKPTISAEFVDKGAGTNMDTFSLVIDKREPIRQKTKGLTLTLNGFTFKPLVNLNAGEHTFKITIADSYGNKAEASSLFNIELQPINEVLGDLDISKLEHIGIKLAGQYQAHDILKIKDIINRDPHEISNVTGISLRTVIDNVKRSQIVCTQARFNRMQFSELWDRTIWEIAHMSDEEIQNYDQPLDEEGNVIEESQGDIDELRENIALLVICMDDSALKGLTFGDIVSNQPEGTYYE